MIELTPTEKLMLKLAEDYYINKRGCSRETARTYLRTETKAERARRLQPTDQSLLSVLEDVEAERDRFQNKLKQIAQQLCDTVSERDDLLRQRDALLAACKAFVKAWSLPNGMTSGNCLGQNLSAYNAARAAIAAAEKGD